MAAVNEELKRLRTGAKPPVSVRAMAEALGVTSSAYHFYESASGFKQRYLPMGFARNVAAILAARGINPDDVLALAGVESNGGEPATLSPGEELLLERVRLLDVEQRRLLFQLIDQMLGHKRPDRGTMHSPALSYAAREESLS